MKRLLSLLLAVFPVLPSAVMIPLTATSSEAAANNFVAHLTGAEEVADERVVTQAQGQAIFNLSRDGESIRYRLIVANIENVLMAQIHLAGFTIDELIGEIRGQIK